MTQIAKGVIKEVLFTLCKFDLIHFCFSKQFGESCQPFAQLHVSVLTSVVILQLWKLPQSKAWNPDDWLQAKGHKVDEAAPAPTPTPAPSSAGKAEGTTRRGTVIRHSSNADTLAAAIVEKDIAQSKAAAKSTGISLLCVRLVHCLVLPCCHPYCRAHGSRWPESGLCKLLQYLSAFSMTKAHQQ